MHQHPARGTHKKPVRSNALCIFILTHLTESSQGDVIIIYNYKGIGGCDCFCELEIYGNLVICTESEENEGTSVTNWAGPLASQVCEAYGIDPEKLIWIERYKDRGEYNRHQDTWEYPEDFSLVEFNIVPPRTVFNRGVTSTLKHARWKPLAKSVVEELIATHKAKR